MQSPESGGDRQDATSAPAFSDPPDDRAGPAHARATDGAPAVGPARTKSEAGPEGTSGVEQPAALPGPPGSGTAGEPSDGGRRQSWAAWRGRRPFWGGLLILLSGVEILITEKAPLPVVLHIGMQGLAGYLVPAVLVLCGLLVLLSPAQRLFYSILSVLLSLASWLTSNLGGFLVGMLLGLVGGCLTFGWLPDQPPRRRILRRSRNHSAVPNPGGQIGRRTVRS